MREHYDLIIIGGGLAGNSLALALSGLGLAIAVVEANTPAQSAASAAGERALALAAGTVRMLEHWGGWQGVAAQATPIARIHVSDRGHFGKTRLCARDYGVAALGQVITARAIEGHLTEKVAAAGVCQLSPCRLLGLMAADSLIHVCLRAGQQPLNLTARLVVGADGGQSSVRKLLAIGQTVSDYRQTALVTTVRTRLPNANTAFERFTPSGPLALLPAGRRLSSVVWTCGREQADALLLGGQAAFARELQSCFGYRLGEISLVAPVRAFALSLIRAERLFARRAVIVGNAAHQLHPVAGQGFNLGLRDVAVLAGLVAQTARAGGDIGADPLLRRFAQARQPDHDRVTAFTDGLVNLFSTDWPPLAAARNLGLLLLDHSPPLKAALARRAMGLDHWPPGLVGR